VNGVVRDFDALHEDRIDGQIVSNDSLITHGGSSDHRDGRVTPRREVSGGGPSSLGLLVDLWIQVEGGVQLGVLLDQIAPVVTNEARPA
jgi:hypothetical protein